MTTKARDLAEFAADVPETLGTAGQALKINAGATAYEWGTIATGPSNVVWPSDLNSPTNTYTTSGTWSKGSLADDAYVWMYLVGGGGSGGRNTGNPAGYGYGGQGGGARLLYGKASTFDGASYTIGAGATPPNAYQGNASTSSSIALTSAQGGITYTTVTSAYGYGLIDVVMGGSDIALLNTITNIKSTLIAESSFSFLNSNPPTGWTGINTDSQHSWVSGENMNTNRPGGNGIFGGGGGAGRTPSYTYSTGGGSLYAGAGGTGGSSGGDGAVPGGGGGGSWNNSEGGYGGNGNLRVYHV